MNSGTEGVDPVENNINKNDSQEVIGLAEIIQTYCQSNRTGRIVFNSQSASGHLYLQYGQVLHAQFDDLEGSQAVYRMLQWPPGTVTFEEGVLPQKRTIQSTWEQLLIKGALYEDAVINPATGKLYTLEEETGADQVVMTRLQGGQPKLTIVEGELPRQTFEITKDFTHIGRVEGNEIVLPVSSVSSRHCLLTIQGSDVVLQDLNSFNGTSINNKKITKMILQVGDLIQLGTIKLRFESSFKRPKLAPASKTVSKSKNSGTKAPISLISKKPKTENLPPPDKEYVTGNAPIVYHDLKGENPPPRSDKSKLFVTLAAAAIVLVVIILYFFLMHRR